MTRLPPGFSESSLRQAVRLGADPFGLLRDGRERFGDTFTLRLPGDPPRIVLSAPADIKETLTLPADAYRSDKQSIHLNLGASSVLFSDGEPHRRRRQLLTPPLHGARLKSYAHTMQAITDRHLDRLEVGQTVRAQPLMRAITMDVILECVFGVPAQSDRGRRLERAMIDWMDELVAPHMFMLSMALSANRLRRLLDRATARSQRIGRRRRRLLPWRRLGDAKAELALLLLDDVRRCRVAGTGDRHDVLALLVDARYDDGEPMADDDIIDQLITMLVGGHETTANTLAWVLHHLLRDEPALARARTELHDAFGDAPVDPTCAGDLPWLDATIVEAMRLTPIAPAISRTLTRSHAFGEWTVPAGAIVWACVYLVHHRADLWSDPDRFDPTRFVDTSAPRPEHYLPYGGGRRRCLGATFAQFEMRIVLAQLLSRCDLVPLGGPTRAVIRGITAVPADGVPLRVRARRRR